MKKYSFIVLAGLLTTTSVEARLCQFVVKANISGKSNNIKAKPNFEAFRNFVKFKMASTTQSSNQTSGPNISDVTAEYNTNIGGLINEANQNIKDIATSGWEQGKADELERQSLAKTMTLQSEDGKAEIKLTSEDGKTFKVDWSKLIKATIGTAKFSNGSTANTLRDTGTLYKFEYDTTNNLVATQMLTQKDSCSYRRPAQITSVADIQIKEINCDEEGNLSIPINQSVYFESDTTSTCGTYDYLTYSAWHDNDNPTAVLNTNTTSSKKTNTMTINIPITKILDDGISLDGLTFTSDKPLYFLEDDDDDNVNVDDKYLLDEDGNLITNVNVGNNTTATDPLISAGKELLEKPRNYSEKKTGIDGSIEAGVIFNISNGFLGLTVGGNTSFSKGMKLNRETTNNQTTTGTSSTTTNTSSTTTSTESTFELKSKPSFTLALEGGANITKKIGLGVRGKYINKRYELTHSRDSKQFKTNLSAHQFEIGPVIRANLTKNFSIEAGVAFCPGSKLTSKTFKDKAPYDIYTAPSASISLGAAFRI